MMVDRHIGTGHAARHIQQTSEDIEAMPVWREGGVDIVVKDGETREFRVARPATLTAYQRSLVG